MKARGLYVAWRTLTVKEIRRFARIWIQTILPPMVTTALYLMIFGGLIGGRIGTMQGMRYIDYIVPGLIMLHVIGHSYANAVSSFFSAKFQKSIEELLVSPMPPWIILAGYVGGGVARGMSVGLAVWIVTLFASPPQVHDAALLVASALIASLTFSVAGVINGIYAKTFDDISIIPTFVLTPLTYLGGVFYSIDLLPEPWRTLSLANPILWLIDAFRAGSLGQSDVDPALALSLGLAMTAVLAAFALHLLRTGRGVRS